MKIGKPWVKARVSAPGAGGGQRGVRWLRLEQDVRVGFAQLPKGLGGRLGQVQRLGDRLDSFFLVRILRGSRHGLYETTCFIGGIMGKSEVNGLNGYNWYFDNL
jgi:hypothetical protein